MSDRKQGNRKHLVNYKTESAISSQERLLHYLQELLPQFGSHSWSRHAVLAQNVSSTSRILYLNDLYKNIVNVPGVICEFGVQWGATLTQLINLRSIYEPFNHSRMIYGFDTFSGFPSVHEKDGAEYLPGDMATLNNYELVLEEVLHLIEQLPPLSHIQKFKLVKGDAARTIDTWLEANPHAIISLAIFDMDLYEPTKAVLEKILPRLTKGSVIAFDELNCEAFAGETQALDEVLGLNNIRLHRSPLHPHCAWMVYGE